MPHVTFQTTGQSASAQDGEMLRQVTQSNNWDIPYACENGICGTCIVKATQGKENLSEMEEQERQTLQALGADDGEHRLACQCKVKGDVTIQQ